MTNRVEFELEITGLKLKVKGSKESAAQITSQVSDTLRNLISPPSVDDGGINGKNNHTEDTDATILPPNEDGPKKRGSRKPRQKSPNGNGQSFAIDFKHEADKYGVPNIKWSSSTKALWLLYVVKQITNIDAMTTSQLIDTFQKHFKQAKALINVTRDLGKMKVDSNLWVGEDTTKNPPEWFITEPGEKQVQKLITEQKSKGNGVS